MSRARRLLELLQILRRHRHPVAGASLADELGVSLRTVYRDVATLQGQGARIDGEPGMGYVLRPGFMLPPLMFSDEEIEALVLGTRWVAQRGDARLKLAARNVRAKISAVLPDDLREAFEDSSLLVGPPDVPAAGDEELPAIREAIRLEHVLRIEYRDLDGRRTKRTIWPFALGFFDRVRVVAAWCELRRGYRHFRTDRILSIERPGTRYPRRRRAMLAEWREREGVSRG